MIIREIGTIARSLDSLANLEFREYDLAKGQYLYLVRIAERPGMIQEELSEMLSVERSTVARSIQKLERSGLVRREMAVDNRKSKHLYLTEEGKRRYDFIRREHEYSENRCLGVLSLEEAELLKTLLARVRAEIVNDWAAVRQGEKRRY